jgi:hypothetical protein
LLDRAKIREQRFRWQMINIFVPIAGILLFGLFRMWARKRKYGSGKLNSRKGPLEMMEYVMAGIAGILVYLVLSSWIISGLALIGMLAFFFIRAKIQLKKESAES